MSYPSSRRRLRSELRSISCLDIEYHSVFDPDLFALRQDAFRILVWSVPVRYSDHDVGAAWNRVERQSDHFVEGELLGGDFPFPGVDDDGELFCPCRTAMKVLEFLQMDMLRFICDRLVLAVQLEPAGTPPRR